MPVPGAVGELPAAAVLCGLPQPDGVVAWATKVDRDRRDGLVAIAGGNGRLIAHLLGRLARVAGRVGVATLVGEVSADNHRALGMLCHSGLGVSFRQTFGVVVVELSNLAYPRCRRGPSRLSEVTSLAMCSSQLGSVKVPVHRWLQAT